MIEADPSLEHQIQVKFLGNGEVYVTCNCLVRAITTYVRNPMRRGGRPKRMLRHYASLGDFPVGTATSVLFAAYAEHLPPDHPDRREPS